MKYLKDWPILFKNILRVGDINSNIGVCTLWTERDFICQILEKKDYCVVGNLYSAAGINHMIRNIFANPRIRYLIVWGSDMSASGHSLVSFMKKGVDQSYKIISSKGEIEKEISKWAIEKFRKEVKLIDLRGKRIKEVAKVVKSLNSLPPFLEKPKVFPPPKPKITTFPSEKVGFRVEGKTVAQTWLKVLNIINRFGRIEKTRYTTSNKLKEVLNLIAVITREPGKREYFPHYLPFSLAELKSYYPELLTKRRIPTISYNYGNRLRNMDGVDQIKEIIALLKRRPFSKKGVAFTYKIAQDWQETDTGDTPCLTQILARIQDKKLFLTAHFRSQDMFHGWPRNAFALRRVQKEIADGVFHPMGYLTIITHSAHIYADDFKTAELVLEENYIKELKYKPGYHFHEDPRGNWLIEVDYKTNFKPSKFYAAPAHSFALKQVKPVKGRPKGKIIARLFTPNMQKELARFEGRTAKEVYWQIADWEVVARSDHAFSLGEELAKAEIALRKGIEFKSDAPLDFRMKVTKP